jgi:hypothetical protein
MPGYISRRRIFHSIFLRSWGITLGLYLDGCNGHVVQIGSNLNITTGLGVAGQATYEESSR